jgi:hypothetical protein
MKRLLLRIIGNTMRRRSELWEHVLTLVLGIMLALAFILCMAGEGNKGLLDLF